MENSNKKSQSQNNVNDKDKEIHLPNDIYIPPLINYKFFERRVEYKTEELEYSKEEEKLLSEVKVIIDTDIGTH